MLGSLGGEDAVNMTRSRLKNVNKRPGCEYSLGHFPRIIMAIGLAIHYLRPIK